MPNFHETRMGQQYYQSTMPRIAKSLERIAESLEKNDQSIESILQPINQQELSQAYSNDRWDKLKEELNKSLQESNMISIQGILNLMKMLEMEIGEE